MALQLNPDTTDAYESKTLAEMRRMVFDRLGFIDPIDFVLSQRTMAELRSAIFTRMGFISPLVITGRTLVEIRNSVKNRLGLALALSANTDSYTNVYNDVYAAMGYAGMASAPPGVATLLATWISQAQSTLLARIEFDFGATARTPLFTSGSSLIDATPIRLLAIAYGKAHDGSPDASGWSQQAEKYLSDITQRTPPNIVGQMNAAIVGAHATVYRRFELGLIGTAIALTFGAAITASGNYIATSSDADVSQVDDMAVELLTLANLKAKIGQPDAKEMDAEFERYMADLLKRSPPNAQNIITSALTSANETIYRRYALGISGVSANTQTTGSTPASGRFSQDTDRPSVDDEAVFLLSLANLQQKYGMADAQQTRGDFDTYMDELQRRQPPNATTVVNQTLKDTQQMLYRKYDVFRMERWWTWSLVAGQRFYGTFNDDNSRSVAPTDLLATIGLPVTAHSMTTRRAGQVSITLRNGKVLLAGGTDFNTGAIVGSAEIFDPVTGAFTATGSMVSARSGALFVLLNNGDVLVAGGNHGGLLTTAEIYNVSAGTWSATGSMTTTHTSGTATVLLDGSVLIVGGTVATHATVVAEIYNPSLALFAATGSLNTARQEHGATLLADGTVLIAGGNNPNSFNTAEIYNPVATTFTPIAGTMVAHRSQHGQILLPSGNVLLAGGVDETATKLATAEVYSASAGTFAATSGNMATQRASPMLTLLSNELILVAGGQATASETATADLYSSTTRTFTATGTAMPYANMFANPAALQDGRVLIAGGFDSAGFLSYKTAYFYDPDLDLFYLTGNLNQGTVHYQATAYTANGESLPDTEVFVAAVPANTAVNLSWTMVQDQPFVLGTKIYGRVTGGTKQLIATVPLPATTYIDQGTILPDGALPTENNTQGPGALDPRHVTWVGLSFNDNVWNPLIRGINPMLFAQNINGVPTHYEIRQSLEIWPAPTTTDWKVQVKGYFQPMTFESDDDQTTLDWQAIYLQGLANAMPRFRTAKGSAWFNQLEIQQAESHAKVYIGGLIAGSHQTAKYVPGAIPERNATRPVLLGPYIGYP